MTSLLSRITGNRSTAACDVDGIQLVAVASTSPASSPAAGGVTNSRTSSVGSYAVAGAQINCTAAADAANVGRQWLVNPVGSGKYVALKRVHIGAGINGALAVALAAAPQMQLTRFSFTGTPSGAVITPAKRATADAAPVGSLRTAATGMTVTAVAPIYTYNIAQVLSAIGEYSPPLAVLDFRIEDQIILAPGEGIMIRQASAGAAAAEARFLQVDWAWEEFI